MIILCSSSGEPGIINNQITSKVIRKSEMIIDQFSQVIWKVENHLPLVTTLTTYNFYLYVVCMFCCLCKSHVIFKKKLFIGVHFYSSYSILYNYKFNYHHLYPVSGLQ